MTAIRQFPRDPTGWLYLGLLKQRHHDNTSAKAAIQTAARYGEIPPIIYDGIIKNQPFALKIDTLDIISVPRASRYLTYAAHLLESQERLYRPVAGDGN